MQRLKVFISSRTHELHDERLAVKRKIKEFLPDLVDVFVFEEDAGAMTGSPEEAYEQEVIDSDIYVGLFREEYSKATEKEYRIAFERGKHILIFVSNYQILNRDPNLVRLLHEVEKHVDKPFDNILDLESYVHKSIGKLLVTSLLNKGLFAVRSVREDIDKLSSEMIVESEIDPDAWYFRGNVLAQLGRREEVIESYEKAVAINPNHADAWYYRGNVLAQLGRREEVYPVIRKSSSNQSKSC